MVQDRLPVNEVLNLVGKGVEGFNQGLNQLGRIHGHDADADANPGRPTCCLTSGPAVDTLSFCSVKARRVSLGREGEEICDEAGERIQVNEICLFIQAGDFIPADAGRPACLGT